MNMNLGKHKDWTTTVREARTRSVPLNLPSNLKEYFKNSHKQHRSSSAAEENHKYHNPHGSSYQAEDGRLRNRRREAVVHVSRNNPHPFRIHFPFQTGDRLSTYMVWLPMDKQVDNTPTLPKIHKYNPNQSRALPLGPTAKHHSSPGNAKRQTYENPSTPVSTYQAEISSMAVLRNRVMVDHFPDLTKRRSLIHAVH